MPHADKVEQRSWFSKNLGDGILAWEPLGRIEALFRAAAAQAGHPAGMAVFTRQESEGRLHCEVTVYFSPASAEVARRFDAAPCRRPSPEGLSLLAGSERSWSVLFPERTASDRAGHGATRGDAAPRVRSSPTTPSAPPPGPDPRPSGGA